LLWETPRALKHPGRARTAVRALLHEDTAVVVVGVLRVGVRGCLLRVLPPELRVELPSERGVLAAREGGAPRRELSPRDVELDGIRVVADLVLV
jgi:hypothetical protein